MKGFSLNKLKEQILQKKTFLCIGLDTDLDKIPPHLLQEKDPIFSFNKAIIDATHHFAVAYKPNTAFYEAYGVQGWQALEKTICYINENYPEIFTIADAKRGDIGNTSTMYAKAFFEDLQFDSVTVAPYMGRDSVEPFLAFEDKITILLALTSNSGAFDFQTLLVENEEIYKKVLKTSRTWNSFLLVPGVGAQGGSLSEVCKYGMNENVGLLINSSRGVIYASKDKNFAEKAQEEARKIQQEMSFLLEKENKWFR